MLDAIWKTICELAPWLLLGMAISGILHIVLPTGLIRRRFQGSWGVLRAVLWGIPLPLCSCGVIPTGIGLKNQGASNGASVGFLISTPQTGVDSMLVSASFLGWPFAIYKVFAALITGLAGGWIADAVTGEAVEATLEPKTESRGSRFDSIRGALKAGTEHALEIVRSIWIWLVIGILVSILITNWVPKAWIESLNGLGYWSAMFSVLVFSVPLYVCATASVPIAAALVEAGMPPSAALVFLIAGPATNVTTIGAVAGRFGWRVLFVYLGAIIGGSMILGWLFDRLFGVSVSNVLHMHHEHQAWWQIGSAIILIGLLSYFAFQSSQRTWNLWFAKQMDADDLDVLRLQVHGMHCQSCTDKLRNGLQKLPGVKHVDVDLPTEKVSVFGSTSQKKVVETVRELGFEPISNS